MSPISYTRYFLNLLIITDLQMIYYRDQFQYFLMFKIQTYSGWFFVSLGTLKYSMYFLVYLKH